MKKTLLSLFTMLLLVSCVSTPSSDPADVHNFVTATRAFYLWRCGMAVETDYDGNHYATEACHLDDGYCDYIGMPGEKRDGTGGWHDAGDFGKYMVNAGITMGVLFNAWLHFADRIEVLPLDLPETAPGYPEFLEEMKWETDFLLKLQYPDGSGRVSHKLTRLNFSPFIMPQDDYEPRYFTVWSSAATADFVAVMAMASRIFRPYDEAYADRLLAAARISWHCLEEYPDDVPFIMGDFKTGAYTTTDPDDRLWAAVEMWEATGEELFLKDAEQRMHLLDPLVVQDWDWQEVSNLGLYTYMFSAREGRDPVLVDAVRAALIADADDLVQRSEKDPWGRALERYYWGCNGTLCRQALNLHVADMLAPADRYGETIHRLRDHVLGNNVYGRSFVTGLGVNPPMHPHDRRSGADGIDAPWPGYIVGGGHTANDWVDVQSSASHNEVAINWQAGLVYLFAACL